MNIYQHTNRFRKLIALFLTASLFISAANITHAQNNCTNNLKEAESMYENGRIDEIPALLKSCLKKGFTKEEQVRAYRIIIKSYLFNQDIKSASQSMLSFLKEFPEYIPEKNTDGADFLNLYRKFETLPVIAIGGYAGVNITNIAVIQSYALNNDDKQTYEYGTPGFQLGLIFSRPVHKYLDINLGVALERYNFNYTSEAFGFSKTTLQEHQTHLSIPISGTFVYQLDRWHPFVKIGIKPSFLIDNQATPNRVYINNSNDDITGTDIDMANHRNNINLSLTTEIGIRYKIQEGYLFFNAGYQLGLLNLVNTNERYNNPELLYIYYYLDDDFKLNNMSFSIGYTRMLYKPKPKQR
jgi:hypothetical protein